MSETPFTADTIAPTMSAAETWEARAVSSWPPIAEGLSEADRLQAELDNMARAYWAQHATMSVDERHQACRAYSRKVLALRVAQEADPSGGRPGGEALAAPVYPNTPKGPVIIGPAGRY